MHSFMYWISYLVCFTFMIRILSVEKMAAEFFNHSLGYSNWNSSNQKQLTSLINSFFAWNSSIIFIIYFSQHTINMNVSCSKFNWLPFDWTAHLLDRHNKKANEVSRLKRHSFFWFWTMVAKEPLQNVISILQFSLLLCKIGDFFLE